MHAQLERYGRANDGVLPFKRRRQRAHPFLPIGARIVEHAEDGGANVAGKGFVRPEEEDQVALDPEWALRVDQRNRPSGREAKSLVRGEVTNVIGAKGPLGAPRSPIRCRDQPHPHPRRASDRLQNARESQRPVNAIVATEARAEIDNLERVAARIPHCRAQDRRIALIALVDFGAIEQIDRPHTACVGITGVFAAQQRAECGVAIDARNAGPDDTRMGVDERTNLTIADRRQIQTAARHNAASSHARTA
jgi:hypothetical protein